MLYSPQNWLPMPADTYCGKPFAESGMKPHDLSDLQRKFLIDDNVRHVLVGKVESPATDAREHSIAGGDPFEPFTDRSYHGK